MRWDIEAYLKPMVVQLEDLLIILAGLAGILQASLSRLIARLSYGSEEQRMLTASSCNGDS